MSTYQDTLEYLFNQFPQYQKIGVKAYKPDLSNIYSLCNALGNPHNTLQTIHVAGTNGKGSVVHMLGSVFQEAGYKVGIFTSPHLSDFRERIKINGTPLSKEFVIEFVEKYKAIFAPVNPSFFEWTTALAFYYFKKEKVDFAIVETGLGGRLDSTNVISPIFSIITTIGKDHQNILGNSIKEIAYEKGGIIKENTPVIVGSQIKNEALDTIKTIAKEKNSKLHIAENKDAIKSDLKGDFQLFNSSIVSKAIEIFGLKFSIDKNQLNTGLQNVIKNTSLRGRWEVLDTKPLTIADIGHNEQAFSMICKELKKFNSKNIYFILGISDDKNIESMLEKLPHQIYYVITQPCTKRALSSTVLKDGMKNFPKTTEFKDPKKAFLWTKNTAQKEDLIFIGGSAFLVADILSEFFPT